jgi:hypothetical protein
MDVPKFPQGAPIVTLNAWQKGFGKAGHLLMFNSTLNGFYSPFIGKNRVWSLLAVWAIFSMKK